MKLWKLAIIMFSIVIGSITIFAVLLFIANRPLTDLTVTKSGLFGDSFGVINTLFTGMAFAGLILTIHLQRQELAESKTAFKRERFEDSFFRLLDYYRQNLNDIRVVDHTSKEVHQGVGALNHLIKKLNISMRPCNSFLKLGNDGLDMYCFKLFRSAYNTQFRQTRYLGTLECLLDQINTECSTITEKQKYWTILSSQLTGFEVSYLFYVCLVAPPNDKLRKLIHDSTLIQHPIIVSMINKHHLDIYQQIHAIHFNSKKSRIFLPFDKKQLRQIRKNIKKFGTMTII